MENAFKGVNGNNKRVMMAISGSTVIPLYFLYVLIVLQCSNCCLDNRPSCATIYSVSGNPWRKERVSRRDDRGFVRPISLARYKAPDVTPALILSQS